MDSNEGIIYHNVSPDFIADRKLTPLPSVNEVLEIKGCMFVVVGYDKENNQMTLQGISKEKAKSILMGGKL